MDCFETIQDRVGLAEMTKLMREGKTEGAAMVFSTMPERDQELILLQMAKHMPRFGND